MIIQSLTLGNIGNSEQANNILKEFNCRNGSTKQLKFYILLYSGVPPETALDQKTYWKGGNKNEFVLCVGIDNAKISWIRHFCWSPDGYAGNDEIGIEMRDMIGEPSDIVNIAENLISKSGRWKRKSFKEFEYLTVKPSETAIWTSVAVNICFMILIGATPFIDDIKDKIDDYRYNKRGYYRSY